MPVDVARRTGNKDIENLLGGLEDDLDLDMAQEDSELASRESDLELEMTSQGGALRQEMTIQESTATV